MGVYKLEIYEPGDEHTVLAALESDTPLVVAVGEALHTGTLFPDAPNRTLTVERVEHTFWQGDKGVVHKRMVFTREPG